MTWSHPKNRTMGVSMAAMDDFRQFGDEDKIQPRIYIAGGAYMGTHENNVVRELEGYVDVWWSYNGSKWNRINHVEGSKASLYSTNEWTRTWVENKYLHLGKWGHTMESFYAAEDLNYDGIVSNETSIEFCGGEVDAVKNCKISNVSENLIPAFYVIGGKFVDQGPAVHDVFISQPGVLCEIDGITCNGRGTCGPAMLGCVCDSDLFLGEYCEGVNTDYHSSVFNLNFSKRNTQLSVVFLILFLS